MIITNTSSSIATTVHNVLLPYSANRISSPTSYALSQMLQQNLEFKSTSFYFSFMYIKVHFSLLFVRIWGGGALEGKRAKMQ